MIEAEIETIDGWLHPREARRLYELARHCQGRGAIVEIGSWKGKSTVCLARGSLAGQGAKVHAIDPHTGSPEHAREMGQVWTFDEFRQNIERAGLQAQVEPHVDFSTSVAKVFSEPVELVFIDGLHEYEGVKADFDGWFPKVMVGGTIAFHDTTGWPGVLKVVVDDVFKSRHFRRVRFVRSIVHAEKVAQNTFTERLGNRVMLAGFLIHAFINRWSWRLIHHYLDFPITRSFVRWVKERRREKVMSAAVRQSV